MAGESASQAARRQRAKAARLEQSAELWDRGAAGERATAEVLALLPGASWTVFHDVQWPGRRNANIDHVVVGAPGVFVIDSKNWSGRVVVQAGVLRQNGRSRELAVAGAADSALAVSELTTAVSPDLVWPVLCFARDEELSGCVRNVMICSTSNLLDLFVSRDPVLTPEQVARTSASLHTMLRRAIDPLAPSTLGAGPSSARPRTVRKAGRTSRGSKFGPITVVKAMVAAAFIGVLLLRPEAITSVTQGLAERFVAQLVPDPVPDVGKSPRPGPDGSTQDSRSPKKDERRSP